jgi:hypothetical protein
LENALDLVRLAQSIYGPVIIAAISILITSSMIDCFRPATLALDKISALLLSSSTADEVTRREAAEKTSLVRFLSLIFFFFAWPSFFYAIGNLFPVTISWSVEDFIRASNNFNEYLCAANLVESSHRAMFAIRNADGFDSSAAGESARRSIEYADRVLIFARSASSLLLLVMAIALLKPSYRSVHYLRLSVSLAVIAVLWLSVFDEKQEALLRSADLKVQYALSTISEAETDMSLEGCMDRWAPVFQEWDSLPSPRVEPSIHFSSPLGILPN